MAGGAPGTHLHMHPHAGVGDQHMGGMGGAFAAMRAALSGMSVGGFALLCTCQRWSACCRLLVPRLQCHRQQLIWPRRVGSCQGTS